ncbi:MAG: division plane positioning ATPase MipZ [Pirellulaceae bacterium]
MSTIDQAFVQAFARRNRRVTTATTTHAASSEVQTTRSHSSSDVSTESRSASRSTIDSSSVPQSDAIHWIDPAKDNLLRADIAENQGVPQPHVPAAQPATASPPPQETPPKHFVNEETFLSNALSKQDSVAYPSAPVTSPRTDAEQPYISAKSQSTASAPQLEQPAQFDRHSHSGFTATKSAESGRVVQQRIDTAAQASIASHIEPAPATIQAAVIQAAWEVDIFDVPASVSELFFKEDLFQTVAQRLHDAVTEGLSSMMVTSARSGEGRSTVAIGMAMAAAASGLRVALVDGDLNEPTLVDDLRLDVDYGWCEALRGGLPLSQVAVLSIEDNLTLIPLVPGNSDSVQATDQEIAKLIELLSQQFDLIVIDTPSGDVSAVDQYAALVDSAVITRDASRTDVETINALSARLRSRGLQGIGIVENFA